MKRKRANFQFRDEENATKQHKRKGNLEKRRKEQNEAFKKL